MSNLLAFDASSEECSVALLRSDGRRFERFEHAPRRQAQLLLPMVKEVLEEATLKSSDLDLVAFGRGPGSFTGLRITAGVAQGLCYGADCLALPVSNIEAMAFERLESESNAACLVMIDARMDEVYWGLCVKIDNKFMGGEQERVSAPESIAWQEARENLGLSSSPTLECVGSGLAYEDRFPASLREAIMNKAPDVVPQATSILSLAQYKLAQGIQAVEAQHALPTYLRDQVAWKKFPSRANRTQ